MASLRVMVLLWADLLPTYIIWIMQTYLTNVWKLGFTHAAGIMNVASGLAKVIPLVLYYFVDAGLGNYWMLLLSSFSYVIQEMAEEQAKAIIPESVLKKQKRNEEWALAKKQDLEGAKKKKNLANRKLIYNRAKLYAKEYEEQQRELIRLKREARLKGGFYVNAEAKLLFIIRTSEGLGFLSMSTPPVLAKVTDTCKDYEPQCIGHAQKALFYTVLALIAVGISGHIVSLVALFIDQFEKKPEKKPVQTKENVSKAQMRRRLIEELEKGGRANHDMSTFPPPPPPPVPINRNRRKPDDTAEVDLLALQFQPVEAMLALVTKEKVKIHRAILVILVPVIGLIALPYIKPWSLRFGIPAICTLVATLAFLHGSPEYKENKSKGSPVTNVFRVTLAAFMKMFKRSPSISELYERPQSGVQKLDHTSGLRCLDKAAIEEGPMSKRWKLCTVTEVEETKIVIRMLPIWITLIICGVVTSIGSTYFVEQANHMNYKVGKLKLPNSILLILYEIGKSSSKRMYTGIASNLRGAGQKKYAPPIGIALATLSSVLCCVIAALVENKRIQVITDHGLIDKPDDKIPMTVFWLLPQYLVLAGLDSFYENSVTPFLNDQSPPSMQRYLVFLNPGLSGLGIMGSVLSVYVVGRVSQRNGRQNWFQYNLNGSRLDRYYWTLALLCAANFFWFLVWSIWFPYREPTSNADEETGNQGGILEAIANGQGADNNVEEKENIPEPETSNEA